MSADPLPTVQINGVVWSQAVIGNTVYAGGNFTAARPAGSAPGKNEVRRTHLLAFDIRTGNLISSFAPSINGQVLTVAASPDGSRLYVGGQFTSVNGVTRGRIAAFNTADGSLVGPFRPSAGTTVRAIAASNSTVYFGGDFNAVGGVARSKAAAAAASNGALTAWNPGPNGSVTAMTMNPAGTRVVLGGRFTQLGGSNAYGMGAVDVTTGAARPWAVESIVRTAGVNAAVTSLVADGASVYGTSYTYGSGGNFEGTFRAEGTTGALEWISDCHGDHYSVWPAGDVVYNASHAHYCGNIGDGFSDTNPRTYYHSTALTNRATVKNSYNPAFKLQSFDGLPSPTLLHWYPVWSVGSFTGQTQAGWTVTGNSDYLTYGGEFTAVNGKAQQGLVRFARAGLAPKAAGPQKSGGLTPAVVSTRAGQVDVGWQATFDRDNRALTYRLYRNFTSLNNTPIATTTVHSTPWSRPTITFRDSGRPVGSTQRYRVFVFDPHGRNVSGSDASVRVADSATGSAYGTAVLSSGPEHWYRASESSGSTLTDSRGAAAASGPASLVRGVAGATGDGDRATTFPGTSSGYVATGDSLLAPAEFSVEAWIRTSTTRGGWIVGFGDRKSGLSKPEYTDRLLYMDNQGRVRFGVNSTVKRSIASGAGLNDNRWHHIVGTLGPAGMRLFVDGTSVASNSTVTSALASQGHWRVGGDTLSGWENRPSSDSFAGAIDDIAIYHRQLSAAEISAHTAAASGGSGGPAPANQPPTAAFSTTTAGMTVTVDGSGSTDPDGSVVSYQWDFGDGGKASGAKQSHTYASAGTYTVGLTVTDDAGATDRATRSVTVGGSAPPTGVLASDTFGRSLTGGWGSADVGGSWSVAGGAANFSVAQGWGLAQVPGPGKSVAAYLDGVRALDQDITVTMRQDVLANGGGAYLNVAARGNASTAYRAKVWTRPDGSVRVNAVRLLSGSQTTLAAADAAGVTVRPGSVVRVRVQVSGASPTTFRIKVWADGQAEPTGWTTSVTDSTSALQGPAGTGLMLYVSGSATNAPITFRIDDVVVR